MGAFTICANFWSGVFSGVWQGLFIAFAVSCYLAGLEGSGPEGRNEVRGSIEGFLEGFIVIKDCRIRVRDSAWGT